MNQEKNTNLAPNKYLMMFIVFWLGVLTGALALMALNGVGHDKEATKASVLSAPLINIQSVLPSPTILLPGPNPWTPSPIVTPITTVTR